MEDSQKEHDELVEPTVVKKMRTDDDIGIKTDETKSIVIGNEKDCTRDVIKQELESLGCCEQCTERYLGSNYPETYRLKAKDERRTLEQSSKLSKVEDGEKAAKIQKKNICVACLGLLQEGIHDEWLDFISADVNKRDLEATSVCLNVSLPICIQLRAFSLWYYLLKKFPGFYKLMADLKPEGIGMKAAWKWVCSRPLQEKIKAMSEWNSDGLLNIQINTTYEDEEAECSLLFNDMLKKLKKGERRKREILTRNSLDIACSKMDIDEFSKIFKCPPPIPSKSLQIHFIECQHVPVFVAGRYCKYSRTLSQTPWVIDGIRKTETSVEELIQGQILAYFKPDTTRFSSSGREDVDVRCLGKGRPFVFELVNPKRVKFGVAELRKIQENINANTKDISVRDLQLVERKDIANLKEGEESKTKHYGALCCLSEGVEVTQEMLDKLNSYPVPFDLLQKTPVRVLHRRSNACRRRTIFEMKAEPVIYDQLLEQSPFAKSLFKLQVKTQAGTYVKEFVHGDLGRTVPNVSQILGLETDIKLLDVESVDVEWPKEIE